MLFMFIFFRLLLVLMILIFSLSCNDKILYSGKILNEENLELKEDILEDEEFIEGECFEI